MKTNAPASPRISQILARIVFLLVPLLVVAAAGGCGPSAEKSLGHNGRPVASAVFSPDGRFVLTGSYGGAVKLWDVDSGETVGVALHEGVYPHVAFAGDGKQCWSAADYSIACWDVDRMKAAAVNQDFDLETLRRLNAALAHLKPAVRVRGIALSPDGSRVLVGLEEGAQLWDLTTREVVASFRHVPYVEGIAWSPDGKTILTCGSDGKVQFWDASSRGLCEESPREPLEHPAEVDAAAFSADGKTIVTGCRDKTARLWDAETGKPIGEPLGHPAEILAVTFSPDGKWILTGCGSTEKDHESGEGRLYAAAARTLVGKPLKHARRVDVVAFSPDSQTFATVSGDAVRLWKVADLRR